MMWQQGHGKSDIEEQLYPVMLEDTKYRWDFIRKVYIIIAFQLVLTIGVGSIVVKYHPIANFFTSSPGGLALYIIAIIFPFLMLCPLYFYHRSHPANYILLFIFTLSLAFAVGLTCAFTSSGKVILESVILTTVVVLGLTLYTFWASYRKYDFNFLGPFLLASMLVLIVFTLIQIFFPLGKLGVTIYGCVASFVFCGYIVYDTNNLIERHTYDQYIWAAVALYLDIIYLFLSVLTVFQTVDS